MNSSELLERVAFCATTRGGPLPRRGGQAGQRRWWDRELPKMTMILDWLRQRPQCDHRLVDLAGQNQKQGGWGRP
jgi:hypothetical protein